MEKVIISYTVIKSINPALHAFTWAQNSKLKLVSFEFAALGCIFAMQN